MSENRFDHLTRYLVRGISRRGSLMTLGGAAVGALTAPAATAARRRGKKRRNRCKCKKECRREKNRCRDAVKAFCADQLEPPFNLECEAVFGACCQSCKVGNGVHCMLELAIADPISVPGPTT